MPPRRLRAVRMIRPEVARRRSQVVSPAALCFAVSSLETWLEATDRPRAAEAAELFAGRILQRLPGSGLEREVARACAMAARVTGTSWRWSAVQALESATEVARFDLGGSSAAEAWDLLRLTVLAAAGRELLGV